MAKKKIRSNGYSTPGYKNLNCSKCNDVVYRVADEAISVVCWKCTMKK